MHEIVLCADSESLRDPSMIGLEGEFLEKQRWLIPLSSANEAREHVKGSPGVNEIWVASSDEVDPINLAAALKRDCQEAKVCLVAWRGSGSLLSRASAAGIDEVMGYPEMARRYAENKSLFQRENPRRRTPTNPVATRDQAVETASGGLRRPRHGIPYTYAGDAEVAFDVLRDNQDDAAAQDTPVAVEAYGDAASGVREDPPQVNESIGRRGYVLCVVSASGGTGKSTISALSALIAAGHGYRTALIDADLQFGDVAAMFGEEDGLTVDQVVAEPRLLEEAAKLGGPIVVSAPERIEQSELYLSQMPGLIERARDCFDVVVVNTGSFWTESHVQMMEASSNTLFLMDQRPTSVKAVRKALELCARCGVAAHPFLFAVNRCSRKALLSSIDISCALNGVAVAELKEGGPAVAELMSSGMARQLVEERNDLCLSLNDFLGRVIPAALGGAVPDAVLDDGRDKPKSKQKRKSLKRRGRAACL
ncbi:MAG: P-loop NTPase [Coriobacteriia bacterium]|nr:P-loop NTPase [Coriobacteriia bacterium]